MPTINISAQNIPFMDVSVSKRLDVETGRTLTTVDVYLHPEPSADDGARGVARDREIDASPVGDD